MTSSFTEKGSDTQDAMTLTASPSKPGSIASKRGYEEGEKTERAVTDETNDTKDVAAAAATEEHQEPDGILTGLRLYLVFLALMLAVFVRAHEKFELTARCLRLTSRSCPLPFHVLFPSLRRKSPGVALLTLVSQW